MTINKFKVSEKKSLGEDVYVEISNNNILICKIIWKTSNVYVYIHFFNDEGKQLYNFSLKNFYKTLNNLYSELIKSANDLGQQEVDKILNDPQKKMWIDSRGCLSVRVPDGRGVKYYRNSELRGLFY